MIINKSDLVSGHYLKESPPCLELLQKKKKGFIMEQWNSN